MNVFAALISPPVLPAAFRTSERDKPPRRDYRTVNPGDERYARKLWKLPKVANPWGLTPHQALILQHLSAGHSNAEIGEALGLNVKTVEAHVANAYERMQATETAMVNRVRAAVLWDRHTRPAA